MVNNINTNNTINLNSPYILNIIKSLEDLGFNKNDIIYCGNILNWSSLEDITDFIINNQNNISNNISNNEQNKNRSNSNSNSNNSNQDVINLTNNTYGPSLPPVIPSKLSKEEQEIQKAIEQSLIEPGNNNLNISDLNIDDQELQKALLTSLNKSNNSDVDPLYILRKDKVPVGIKNVGNTCYFSSLLQTYNSLPQFINTLMQFKEPILVDNNPKREVAIKFILELQKNVAKLRLGQEYFIVIYFYLTYFFLYLGS